MGFLSCNSESAIITCDPYNWEKKKKKKKKRREPKIRQFSYSDLESATNGFSPQSFLGKGSHGSVYKAVLDDGKLIVAVKKRIHSSLLHPDNELEILSRVRSPRLVNLLGFSLDINGNNLLVVEFMPNGSLYDLLHSSNRRAPGLRRRVRYALQIAKAIEILHASNPPVIHRDVKSSNVLIDSNWNARLGDFGLALRGCVDDVRLKCTPPAGTLGYLDPGYIAPENLTDKNDVFSFGILLLEILSGRNAIDVNYSPPSIIDWALPLIERGEYTSIYDARIGIPDDISVARQLAKFAAKCVRPAAEKRPAMSDAVKCLGGFAERISSPFWNNLRRRMTKESTSASLSASVYTGPDMFDSSKEIIVKTIKHGVRTSSLKNCRKVASFEPYFDLKNQPFTDRIRRSSSMRSIGETKVNLDTNLGHKQLALVEVKTGLDLGMPALRLSKSRSLSVLQSTRLIRDSERRLVLRLAKNRYIRSLNVTKIVVSDEKSLQKKMIEGRKSL